jgi:carbamoyl-phosphate synthase large subunit
MKSVGEVMAIGRTFKEALMKAWRALETGKKTGAESEPRRLTQRLVTPQPERLSYIRYAFERGMSVAKSRASPAWIPGSSPDPRDHDRAMAIAAKTNAGRHYRQSNFAGSSAWASATSASPPNGSSKATPAPAGEGTARSEGNPPVFKLVDTCAAEFEIATPYLYSTYDEEDEAPPTSTPKIIILGSGPNRIGQGIEFDYCCCHAAFALKEDGYETIMVNCNPRPSPPTTTPATASTLSRWSSKTCSPSTTTRRNPARKSA